MATISLGSGLVNKLTLKAFSDGFNNNSVFGMGGNCSSSQGGYPNYLWTVTPKPSYFSLMKGVVPSNISDIQANQRASDIIITYTGPQCEQTGSARLDTGTDTTVPHANLVKNDFAVTVLGSTATWSAVNISFAPRYPTASGTPTWFWFRSYGREHNIFGTVGAVGSGSDLELTEYAPIDASKEYTMYNATLMNFNMINTVSY